MNYVILFMACLAGVFAASSYYSYQVSNGKKLLAAAVFTFFNWLPLNIPIVSALLPFVALYVALMDSKLDHQSVTKVFFGTVIFCIVGLILVYQVLGV